MSAAIVVIDGYSTVNPYRQPVDKLSFAIRQRVARISEIDYFFGLVMIEYLVLLIENDLWKDEHRRTLGRKIVVADIVHGGYTVHHIEFIDIREQLLQ